MTTFRGYLLDCLRTVTPLGLASLFNVNNAHIYQARKPGGRVSPTLKRVLRPHMEALDLLAPARPRRLKIRRDNPVSAAASIMNNLEPAVTAEIARILTEENAPVAR